MDKFAEKLANFANFAEKQLILWLFSGQISLEWGCLMKGLTVFS